MIKVNSINEYPKMAGIYKFTNKTNGKIYIGESMNLKERMGYYPLLREKRPIIYAFRKYGFSNFEYSIIESFPCGVSKSILLDREEFWIRIYGSVDKNVGYNVAHRGTDRTGVKCSKETLEKMRIARTGMKHSDATRKKMSEDRRGSKHWQYGKRGAETSFGGRKLSEHHKKVFTDATRKKVHQIDLITGQIIATWNSLMDAAINVYKNKNSQKHLSRALRKGLKKHKGYAWAYCEEKSENKIV